MDFGAVDKIAGYVTAVIALIYHVISLIRSARKNSWKKVVQAFAAQIDNYYRDESGEYKKCVFVKMLQEYKKIDIKWACDYLENELIPLTKSMNTIVRAVIVKADEVKKSNEV